MEPKWNLNQSHFLLRGLKSILVDSSLARRLFRTTGEILHHRLPRFGNLHNLNKSPRSTAFEDKSIPSNPHVNSETEPISLGPSTATINPVLTGKDVTDYGDADAVADPFMFITSSGEWHLFMEVFNRDKSPTAAIGHATSPDGGYTWEYDKIILKTDFHLSFPYVFKEDDIYYMLPDPWMRSNTPADHTLYRARNFPYNWTEVADIISPNRPLHDCVVFRWNGWWWALAGDGNNLFLFYSSELEADQWYPHDLNPVVEGRPAAARPAGRPIVRNNYVLVYLQDSVHSYGHKVRAFRISNLTPLSYTDIEIQQSPILTPSKRTFSWNSGKMHHIDPWYTGDKWICAVDGNIGFGRRFFGDLWGIGVYESS